MNKLQRRISVLALALMLVFTAAACGGKSSGTDKQDTSPAAGTESTASAPEAETDLPVTGTDAETEAISETPAADETVVSEIVFGTYEQDNDSADGAEPIEWIVLEKNGDSLLLISKYALECRPFHDVNEEVTWETCSLRSWLNDTFYYTAFTEEEQAAILLTTLPPYTDGAPETQDKVFILSYQEIDKYWPWPDNERACVKPTAHALAQGCYFFNWEEEKEKFIEHGNEAYEKYDGNTWWWLRNPGRTAKDVNYINWNGDPNGYGVIARYNYEGSSYTVRPALWVQMP